MCLAVLPVKAEAVCEEDFEGDPGECEWYATNGTWEVGVTESGPGGGHAGSSQCAATVLRGNYEEGVRSLWVCPPCIVPAASLNPRFRFWHWYSFSSADYGNVQIKVDGGEWETISNNYNNTSSGVWTRPSIDLSAYAGSTVEIGFYFRSDRDGWGHVTVSAGWYIDDVVIVVNDALDTDGDWILNSVEALACTDPQNPDSDKDGLSDGAEDVNRNGQQDPGELNACEEDTDGDGMPDGWEVAYDLDPFHDDTNEDPDNDGLANIEEYQIRTNPKNSDTDGDRMPDGWEYQYDGPDGLQPTAKDADGDLDSDGISNLEEYLAGTDPTHKNPPKPVLLFPIDGSVDVPVEPELVTEPFSGADPGDTHFKTQWQISRKSDFKSLVLNVPPNEEHLTTLKVPTFVLEATKDPAHGKTYYWRVKFFDNENRPSPWAEPFSFTTELTQDLNDNGIPDAQENETVDLDGNGTPDIQQDDIKSLNTVVGDGQMGVSRKDAPTVVAIESIVSIDPETIPEDARPYGIPLGLFGIRLKVPKPGDTAIVKIFFSIKEQIVKFPIGVPTPENPEGVSWFFYDSIKGWDDNSKYVTVSDDKKSIEVAMTDGGRGDADGAENRVIADPGVLVAVLVHGNVQDAFPNIPTGVRKGLQATVKIHNVKDFQTLPDGNYVTPLLPDNYTISASAQGFYESCPIFPSVPEAPVLELQPFYLDPDCNVGDAVRILQFLSGKGLKPPIGDVNGDGQLGLEELIYVLQNAADLRKSDCP
jgi:hypothetical protein